MAKEFGIHNFRYKNKLYGMCADYLMGVMQDENEDTIIVSEEHFEIVKKIYINRIIPLFGEFDEQGKQLSRGKVIFVEERDNPTGIRNNLMAYAKRNGTFITESYTILDDQNKRVTKERIIGYKPTNPNITVIIITDHVRKCKRERNYSMKENVDKLFEYQIELKIWCHWTFVDIIHLNRDMASIDRLKYSGEFIYPTSEDIKDTGNLSEDANMVITMFNPHDEKFGLKKHFGYILENYPNYRSLHIVESRDTLCPQHIRINMFGGTNLFTDT